MDVTDVKTKRWRIWIGASVSVCVLLLSATMGINAFVCASASDRIVKADQAPKADCILVLGAGVRDDGTPSSMLADRLDQGVALYRAGVAEYLLMSGDHGQADYDEVNVMKQYAIDAGVPSEAIFMDHAGFSTYDSMYRARDVFQVQTVVVVSQTYHLYRALYIADQLGLDAYGVGADPRPYVGEMYRTLREVIARNKDFWKAWMQPAPVFLGEAIPVIGGNGDVTNDTVFDF